jgi:hypothetical protein
MQTEEQLMDFARDANLLRAAGFGESAIARAAGFPEAVAPKRRRATPDEIIARILHQDPNTLHPDDLQWWRVTVGQALAYADDPQ